jgi:hypothetical protein
MYFLMLLLTPLLLMILLQAFCFLAVAVLFSIAGFPALDGFHAVVDVLSATEVSIGSSVLDV